MRELSTAYDLLKALNERRHVEGLTLGGPLGDDAADLAAPGGGVRTTLLRHAHCPGVRLAAIDRRTATATGRAGEQPGVEVGSGR